MGWRKWAFPLVVVGMNSIAAYVLGNAFGGWFRSAILRRTERPREGAAITPVRLGK